MTTDPVEWEFDVPASQVDLDRIRMELNGVPAIYVVAYLENLKRYAPTVYARYIEDRDRRGVFI